MGSKGPKLPKLDEIADVALNVAANYFTSGLVGYKDGKISKGIVTKGLDEGLGEITGRNVMRKQLANQEQALAEELAAREKELANQRALDMRNDISASSAAATLRSSATSGSRGTSRPAARTLASSQDERNLLGL